MKRAGEKGDIPARLVRAAGGVPEIDLEQRTVRAVVMTRLLARDGGIVMPGGIILRHYQANSVVLAMHGSGLDRNSPVIGRSLSLAVDPAGMTSLTQFAETDLGREYAYLYGVNPKREVYMRGWSFAWRTIELDWLDHVEAKAFLGRDWDDDAYAASPYERVWVARRSEMHEYSAVAVGADREALSRAYGDGIRAAGEMVTEIDCREIAAELADVRDELNNFQGETKRIVQELEQQLKALRRDGAAAAARGDTAELRERLRDLVTIARKG
jgi:HAMP domain-containing protein